MPSSALVDDLRRDGIEVRFAAAHHQVRGYAARLGLAALAGLVDPYPTIDASVRKPDGR